MKNSIFKVKAMKRGRLLKNFAAIEKDGSYR